MRRLTAAHAKGTVRALQPHAHHLSPALGLLSLGAHHWHGNLVRSSVPSPSTALARELFAEPTGHSPVRLSRSRSRAAAHLGSAQIGTILGLGLNNSADAHDVKTALNRAGIETNRVHGEWTGVSLRRFLRLVELVREGGEGAPAVTLLLRLGWERLHAPQLRVEIPVPSCAEVGAATLLNSVQPAGATLGQADCMLPKALEIRPSIDSRSLSTPFCASSHFVISLLSLSWAKRLGWP